MSLKTTYYVESHSKTLGILSFHTVCVSKNTVESIFVLMPTDFYISTQMTKWN
ncbi:unnamed protein product [Schistosoma mattheei]|uniref:Uncharacterized protein n=1 Tax=Schistosoma mattheei TaxID=31246 RepID=A0A3P8EJU4_9TREM|nr:unnamed protein product [Schistosoma mattheei]